MKKITLLLALFAAGSTAFAQSQRIVLFEEFTQASCPPCAVTNPGLNDMLNAHPTEVVSVKYQTDWPGTDPMNLHNPSEVQTRVTYYAVSGVPDGELDGGLGFSGQPINMTYGDVSSRSNVSSPFTINVDFNVNGTNDTISATATIICTQAVTGTNMVAHMAVIERNIFFNSAPGTNGEKHFEGVMKKMLPNASGTSVASAWNVGDSLVLEYNWKLAHVYNVNELAVVAWVQSNSSKEVYQAGYKAPNITLDAGVNNVTDLTAVTCNNTVTPSVEVQNFAPLALNSVDIGYSIDNGVPGVYNYTGQIASNGTATIALPTISLVGSGLHTLKMYTFNPNTGLDQEPFNDTIVRTVYIYANNVTTPVTQNFLSAVFPPAGFAVDNVDHDDYSWARVTTGHNGAGSAKLNFYNAAAGTIDNMYAPKLDFANAIAGANLTFEVAHAIYSSAEVDRLKVNVSSDCGANWNTVYNKGGSTLATVAAATTSAFTPLAANWRLETVSLDQFIGQPELLIQFQGISAYGNNVYVDNINISDGTVSVPVTLFEKGVKLYPNPTSGLAYLNVNIEKPADLQVKVLNTLGAEVKAFNFAQISNETLELDLTGLAKGSYVVSVISGSEIINSRLNITE